MPDAWYIQSILANPASIVRYQVHTRSTVRCTVQVVLRTVSDRIYVYLSDTLMICMPSFSLKHGLGILGLYQVLHTPTNVLQLVYSRGSDVIEVDLGPAVGPTYQLVGPLYEGHIQAWIAGHLSVIGTRNSQVGPMI